MIVKFQSTATADVITFADVARKILQLIGKEATAQGVVTPAEMPEVLARLAALNAKPAADAPEDNGHGIEPHELIALATRVKPFIAMFDRAHLADKAVTWTAAKDFHDA